MIVKVLSRRFPTFQLYLNQVGTRDSGYKYCAFLPESPGEISMWVDPKERIELGRDYLFGARSKRTPVPFLIEDCLHSCENMEKVSLNLYNGNPDLKDPYELRTRFESFVKAELDLARYMLLPHSLEAALTESITKWLTEKLGSERKAEPALLDISVSNKESNAIKEQKGLLKIAMAAQAIPELSKKLSDGGGAECLKEYPKIEKLVDDHANEYAWMSMVSLSNPPRKKEEFIKGLSDMLESDAPPKEVLESLETRAKGVREKAVKTIEELNPPTEMHDYINALQELVFLRTYRMDIFGKAHYHSQQLFEEMARAVGTSVEESKFLTHREIIDLLESGRTADSGIIKNRMNALAIVMNEGVIEIYGGKEAEGIKQREMLKAK